MQTLGLFLIFIIIVFFVSRIEYARFRNLLTPYFYLVTPISVILALNIISSTFSSFYLVEYETIFWCIVYSTSFLIGSLVVSPLIKKKQIVMVSENVRYTKLISVASILVSAYMIKVASSLISSNSDIFYLSTDGFAKDYGSGSTALLRVLTMIFLIYLIGFASKKNKAMTIPAILITILPFFIYAVKGLIFIPLLGGLIFRFYLGRLKLNAKMIVNSVLLIFLGFVLVYSIPYLYAGMYDTVFNFGFVSKQFKHVFSYLFSGILGYSGLLKFGTTFDPESRIIISPLWNIVRHITGAERIQTVVTDMRFYSSDVTTTNVFTIFGTMHLYLGPWLTICVSGIIGTLSYMLKLAADNSQNLWLKVSYCFNLSILAFGWFDYYYYYNFIWLFWIFCIIFSVLPVLFKSKKRLEVKTTPS